MLNIQIAQLLVQKLAECTDYNINIIDQAGSIIASTDSARVNQFHEGAYQMVCNGEDVLEITSEDTLSGSREGVNMTIRENGKPVGVVGITGKLEEVRPIAMMLKMTVETILELEERKQQAMRHSNLKQYFINGIVYNNISANELWTLAKALHYPLNAVRIPILIDPGKNNSSALLDRVKDHPLHTGSDISAALWNDMILVFRHLEKGSEMRAAYRENVEEYLDVWRQASGSTVKFYVGTLQNSLSLYHAAFQHAFFLQKHITPPAGQDAVYFYDYLLEYFQFSLPHGELDAILGGYCSGLDSAFAKDFIPLSAVLRRENYNLSTSSKQLYIHKNTLSNRLERYRLLFGANPMRCEKDRTLFAAVECYLRNKYGSSM